VASAAAEAQMRLPINLLLRLQQARTLNLRFIVGLVSIARVDLMQNAN
jgi:hypothetical protein